MFRLLVEDGKAFTFAAGKRTAGSHDEALTQDSEEIVDLFQPEDDERDTRGVFQRHSDSRLQTRLTSEGLQKRLLSLHLDARTLQEEQGVNVLFLAAGFLKWFEDDKSDVERFAPLVLIPVALDRGSVGEKFKLRWLQEDPVANLSLAALMKRQFGLELPQFAEGDEAFQPASYFRRVADAVSGRSRWSVLADDMVLGFFSFAKFLMYRDLDPALWPEGGGLPASPIIQGLLGDGFPAAEGLIGEDDDIDAQLPPEQLVHVVDADSSQTLAIHEARSGRNLVIQGPPGTGKSQTIANVIAGAVYDGKRVLFVAEKMAALEVVKRRLDAAGVGDMCLELHSNKTNKRNVLQELKRTWELGRPQASEDSALLRQLRQTRDELNAHAKRLHVRDATSGLTPYQVLGHLVRLRRSRQAPAAVALVSPESWTKADREEREALLKDLALRIEDIGRPSDHMWRHAGIDSISPMDLERLTAKMSVARDQVAELRETARAFAQNLDRPAVETLSELPREFDIASRALAAPDLDRAAIGSATWEENPGLVNRAVTEGESLACEEAALRDLIAPGGLAGDIDVARADLRRFGTGWLSALSGSHKSWRAGLERALEDHDLLSELLGIPGPATLANMKRLARIVERANTAPPLDARSILSTRWETSLGAIDALTGSGEAFAAAAGR